MFSQQLDSERERDPYMTTAVDALTVALKSGNAGSLNIAAIENADPGSVLGALRRSSSGPLDPNLAVPEVPLAGIIDGYGSSESKQRLVTAVSWVLHEEMDPLVAGLHEWSTFGDAARVIASQLRTAPPAYRCTAPSKHVFRERGTGLCIFDGSLLERA